MAVTRGGAVERLARLETQMEGVKSSLDRGADGFDKLRQSQDELKQLIVETHAACVKPADLKLLADRIQPLETFRDRVKRYGLVGATISGLGAALIGVFGPTKVGAAVSAAVSKLFG